MFICNCNGIRCRDVKQAIKDGACRPSEIFKHQGCSPQCAKCVTEMVDMIKCEKLVDAVQDSAIKVV